MPLPYGSLYLELIPPLSYLILQYSGSDQKSSPGNLNSHSHLVAPLTPL